MVRSDPLENCKRWPARVCGVAVAMVALCFAAEALAGRNADGALIVHTDDTYAWSRGTACVDRRATPASCEGASTTSTRRDDATVWVVAAFCPSASPSVTSVYFGIDYQGTGLEPVESKMCGPDGSFEIPDEDWPFSGRGNTIAFAHAVTDLLFPVYAFRMDGGAPGAWFCTRTNPMGGYASFTDDSDPPFLDFCLRFGCLRWFAPGYAECGSCSQPQGACCAPDGSCSLGEPDPCVEDGGDYRGDFVPCDPDPCIPRGVCCFGARCELRMPARCAEEGGLFVAGPEGCADEPCAPRGSCCTWNGLCEVLTRRDCDARRGLYWTEGEDCIEDCPQPVIERGSWGRIRSIYR